jgi:spore coat protein CotF
MHKCGAVCKMNAALECADPQLRRIIMQGANSCAEQAYELFTFMNQRGMYQVPTMQQQTQDNFMNIYQHSGTQGMMPHQANINYTGAQGLI